MCVHQCDTVIHTYTHTHFLLTPSPRGGLAGVEFVAYPKFRSYSEIEHIWLMITWSWLRFLFTLWFLIQAFLYFSIKRTVLCTFALSLLLANRSCMFTSTVQLTGVWTRIRTTYPYFFSFSSSSFSLSFIFFSINLPFLYSSTSTRHTHALCHSTLWFNHHLWSSPLISHCTYTDTRTVSTN